MARSISYETTDTTPNLSGLGISPTVLERYGVVEAHTSLGRRIAFRLLPDCTKLMAWDGSYVWGGEFVPEAGLFGQRVSTVSTLILCAHEFEALRVASVIEDDPKLSKRYHAVALPTHQSLGRVGMSMLVDSLKVVAKKLIVWGATTFDSLRDFLEQFIAAVDENSNIDVETLSLSGVHSPLDLTDAEISNVLNGASRKWSPSNLVTAEDVYASEQFFQTSVGYSTGIASLDRFIMGLRKSELVMNVAGTGVGKSTLLRQIIYHLAYKEGQQCLLGFFEETKEETLKKLACIHYQIPFTSIMQDPHALSDEQWEAFLKLDATKNLRFLNQATNGGFGGMDVDTILSTVRYLKRKSEVDFVAIDHISIMVSGKESSKEGERKDIDILMTKLAMACVMLEVGILGICHLSKPDGQPHEEGGRVALQHMRGSQSLKQLSWCVIAQERDQQGANNKFVTIRVLKNRNGGGRTGIVTTLEFVDPLLVERNDVVPEEKPVKSKPASSKAGGLFGGKKATLGPAKNV